VKIIATFYFIISEASIVCGSLKALSQAISKDVVTGLIILVIGTMKVRFAESRIGYCGTKP
jgi:hypothetical protein